MTPEEHEKYIANLEVKTGEAMASYRQRRQRAVYPFLLLAATATTLWLICKAVEAWLS